jgi:hypothetical protein
MTSSFFCYHKCYTSTLLQSLLRQTNSFSYRRKLEVQHEAQAQEGADSLVQWWKPANERLSLHSNIEENAPEYYMPIIQKYGSG